MKRPFRYRSFGAGVLVGLVAVGLAGYGWLGALVAGALALAVTLLLEGRFHRPRR